MEAPLKYHTDFLMKIFFYNVDLNLKPNLYLNLTIEVVEVTEEKLIKASFRAIDKFKLTNKKEVELQDGVILEDPSVKVRAVILEHRVPCLGFCLEEKLHVNINKDRLEEMQVVEGAWLNELKQAVLKEEPDAYSIDVPFKRDG